MKTLNDLNEGAKKIADTAGTILSIIQTIGNKVTSSEYIDCVIDIILKKEFMQLVMKKTKNKGKFLIKTNYWKNILKAPLLKIVEAYDFQHWDKEKKEKFASRFSEVLENNNFEDILKKDTSEIETLIIRKIKSLFRDDVIRLAFRDDTKKDEFMSAVREGQSVNVIKELLRKGADVSATWDWAYQKRMSALHLAALKGHSHLVELLLDAGAEMDSTDNYGSTPLQLAIYYLAGKSEKRDALKKIISILHTHGADINYSSNSWYDSFGKKLETVFTFGVSPGRGNRCGWTPLHLAAYYSDNNPDLVKKLLELGADPNKETGDREKAVDLACHETIKATLKEREKISIESNIKDKGFPR